MYVYVCIYPSSDEIQEEGSNLDPRSSCNTLLILKSGFSSTSTSIRQGNPEFNEVRIIDCFLLVPTKGLEVLKSSTSCADSRTTALIHVECSFLA